jgi:hypothetical protein
MSLLEHKLWGGRGGGRAGGMGVGVGGVRGDVGGGKGGRRGDVLMDMFEQTHVCIMLFKSLDTHRVSNKQTAAQSN